MEDAPDPLYEDDVVGGDAWGGKKKYFYGGNPNEAEYEKRAKGKKRTKEDSDSGENQFIQRSLLLANRSNHV